MYLVDSNILIEAKNRYYAFDIAPGFWDWLDRAYRSSLVCSIENVRDELIAGEDDLATWAKDHSGFFHAIDGVTTSFFGPLVRWATTRTYTQSAIDTFTGNAADFYLIAHARAHGHTLVTHERSSPDSRKRIMIPDACLALGVTYADTFEMMRSCRVRLAVEL